jgi:hypothetical protein
MDNQTVTPTDLEASLKQQLQLMQQAFTDALLKQQQETLDALNASLARQDASLARQEARHHQEIKALRAEIAQYN